MRFPRDAGPITVHQYPVHMDELRTQIYVFGVENTTTAILDTGTSTVDGKATTLAHAPPPTILNSQGYTSTWQDDHPRIQILAEVHKHLAESTSEWWRNFIMAIQGSKQTTNPGVTIEKGKPSEENAAVDGSLRDFDGIHLLGAAAATGGTCRWNRTTDDSMRRQIGVSGMSPPLRDSDRAQHSREL
jgi:hypothetical protein